MKRIFIVAVLAAIVAAAYFGNRYFDRFITDKEYKSNTLAEYEKRVGIYNLSGQINAAIEGRSSRIRRLRHSNGFMPPCLGVMRPIIRWISILRI